LPGYDLPFSSGKIAAAERATGPRASSSKASSPDAAFPVASQGEQNGPNSLDILDKGTTVERPLTQSQGPNRSGARAEAYGRPAAEGMMSWKRKPTVSLRTSKLHLQRKAVDVRLSSSSRDFEVGNFAGFLGFRSSP
jgi:hypothetical protein